MTYSQGGEHVRNQAVQLLIKYSAQDGSQSRDNIDLCLNNSEHQSYTKEHCKGFASEILPDNWKVFSDLSD